MNQETAIERARIVAPLAITHIGPNTSEVVRILVSPGMCSRDSWGGGLAKGSGGVRGKIKGFSRASRLRLLRICSSCDFREGHVFFITLTYPKEFPDFMSSKQHLRAFLKRFERKYGKYGCIWRIEPQKRGAPHFHLIVFVSRRIPETVLRRFTAIAWYKVVGSSDRNHFLFGCRCEKLRSFRGSLFYCGKYLGKEESSDYWGRQWGVVGSLPVAVQEWVILRKDLFKVWRILRRWNGLGGKFFYSTFFVKDVSILQRVLSDYGISTGFQIHGMW